MNDFQRRIMRLVLTGSAAASFLVAVPALVSESDTHQSAQPCVNGVIPWNPFVVNCNLPPRAPRIRGAAPDAAESCHELRRQFERCLSSLPQIRDALSTSN